MQFYITGTPYPKDKSSGDKNKALDWTECIIRDTAALPTVDYGCRVEIEYIIPYEKYGLGAPYGPDIDNLTKRLLDALKQTVFKNVAGEDDCVLELHARKRVARKGESSGALVKIDQVQAPLDSDHFTYFAYGSNICRSKLVFEGAISAEKICNAILPGYKLRMNKKSIKDKSYKANMERTGSSADEVLGVLWSIHVDDIISLKKAEGYPTGYKKLEVVVFDEMGTPWKTVTCIGCADKVTPEDGEAYDWYLRIMLKGALINGFPEDYVKIIQSFKTKKDPDIERSEVMSGLAEEH